MFKISDREYLLKEQYRNASNLNARFQLHERFSINKYGWHQWVFDQFDIHPNAHILELGCGQGFLWVKNIGRIPETSNPCCFARYRKNPEPAPTSNILGVVTSLVFKISFFI
ncbi:hypothetical protein H8E77_38250 [bacterium]|nr:hypothetical protein [bacterium]